MLQLRDSHQKTIDYYEKIISSSRERSHEAHIFTEKEIERLENSFKNSQDELSRSRTQLKGLKEKMKEMDSLLVDYSRDKEELDQLRTENRKLRGKISQLKRKMSPEMREYELVSSKIHALEHWHKNKEMEINRRMEVSSHKTNLTYRLFTQTPRWK